MDKHLGTIELNNYLDVKISQSFNLIDFMNPVVETGIPKHIWSTLPFDHKTLN